MDIEFYKREDGAEPVQEFLDDQPPHTRDFSRELGGFT